MAVRAPSTSSARLNEMFGLEGLLLREDLQQDKEAAVCAVAKMFSDFGLPYAITGGIAVQLYMVPGEVRHTNDVDVISLRDRFKAIKAAQPWDRYGLEFVFDRRRYVKLKHVESNVEIDVNLDTRFARLIDDPTFETVRDQVIPFVSSKAIAFAKLRTQRADWPRDEAKRLQDRADLVRLVRNQPELIDQLRDDAETTQEMQQILNEVVLLAGRRHRR